MKPGSFGEPKIYLGTKISQITLPNGVTSWAFSVRKYVQDVVNNVEKELKKEGLALRKGTYPHYHVITDRSVM